MVDDLLYDLFHKKKWGYIVFRSLLYTVVVVITGNEYYNAIKNEIKGGIIFSPSLFLLIYIFNN